jgi:hypothetical protein
VYVVQGPTSNRKSEPIPVHGTAVVLTERDDGSAPGTARGRTREETGVPGMFQVWNDGTHEHCNPIP